MCISVSTMCVWVVGGSMGVSVGVGGWVWVCRHVRVCVCVRVGRWVSNITISTIVAGSDL